MDKKSKIRYVVEISVFTALGLTLDWIAGIYSSPFWSRGGSISIAMVAIFMIGYKYGVTGGLLTGFLIGTIQILWGYILGIGQVCLDYIIPYTILGFVGLFKNKVNNSKGKKQVVYITIPIIIVCIFRTLSHILSGIIYFKTPFLGSLLYKGPFMLVSTPLCIILTVILQKKISNI